MSLRGPLLQCLSSHQVVFTAGFRVFFLLSGFQALAVMALWLAYYFGTGWLPGNVPPVLWHGHELVFGFAGAALAGFMLTAIPNWTGRPLPGGLPLLVLAAAWLAGRIAFLAVGWPPAWLAMAVGLAFVPLLAARLLPPLLSDRQPRHLVFLAVLAAFWLGDGLVHWEVFGGGQTGLMGLRLGIAALVVAIALVGGRLLPMFMRSWLADSGESLAERPRLERSAVPLLLVALAADLVAPAHPVSALLLLAAALVHGIRLAGWKGHRAAGHPILWVLHAAYAWLVIGLTLLGLSALTPLVPPSAALHAFTTGAIGTAVLGVMTRAGLAHTGRPVVAPLPVAWAYGLVLLAAAVRSLGPIVAPSLSGGVVLAVAGALWLAAFGLFLMVFLPILTRPRVDGKPG